MEKGKATDYSYYAVMSSVASASTDAGAEPIPSLAAEGDHQMHFPEPYADVIKNSVPTKVLLHWNDQWSPIAAMLLDHVREHFKAKRGRLQIQCSDGIMVFDFASMVMYDVKRAFKIPIAWVDDKGRHFFPVYQPGPTGQVGGSESTRFGPGLIQVRASMNPDFVKNIFTLAIRDYVMVEVTNIQPLQRINVQTRAEIFEQFVQIVKLERGYSNVQFGWLATDKNILDNAMTTNAAFPGKFGMSADGFGAQVYPIDWPFHCTRSCTPQEDGVRHILFCRVILGKTEKVAPWTGQARPSSDEFDTGIDYVYQTTRYMVWMDKLDAFIFPEYVLSFRTEDRTIEDMLNVPINLRVDELTDDGNDAMEEDEPEVVDVKGSPPPKEESKEEPNNMEE